MRTQTLALILAVTTFAGLATAQPDPMQPPPTAARPMSTGNVPQAVLDDFIAGFNGDAKAMERAMSASDQLIAKDPNNAEALAWNSSGKAMATGAAFQSGDFKKGMQLWNESKAGMNKAVDLDPNNPRIHIIRGKSMLESSLHDPNPATSTQSAGMAVDDLESAISLFGENFGKKAPTAFQKELYSWLYQGASKIGDKDKAAKYKKLAGDKADEAKQRLEASAGNTLNETVLAATIILDSDFVKSIKPELMAGLRAPAKLDTVIAALDARIQAKPDDAPAIAWRGFVQTLRSGSLLAQGQFEEGAKMWDHGNDEIGKAASTDATCRDAVLLRALSNIERGRQEPDDAKRKEEAAKALTDLSRFQRLGSDAGAPLSGDAKAELHLCLFRAHRLSGDNDKAKAALEAGAAIPDASPEITRKLKGIADIIKQ